MKVVNIALARLIYAVELRLAKQAMKSSKYSFTLDCGSSHLAPIWTLQLSGLKDKENAHLLEIGSFEGSSALWFLENILTHPSSRITCVDMFENRLDEIRFDHNIAISGFSSRMTKCKGRSQEVLKLFKEDDYDVIYIDGSHRAADVQADASLSWPLLKRGGIIIFDDYLWSPDYPPEERPQMAIDNFLIDFSSQIEILHKEYQVIVRRVG